MNATAPSVWQTTVNAGSSIEAQTQITPPGQDVDWSIILFYVWLIGSIVQVFILTKNAFQLYFLKKYSSLQHHPIADYYTNDNTPAAFSFGKTIFLPNENYTEKDMDLILQHEHNHYKHQHWIDNVLLELLQIIFWAHPLFYIFKKQIKLVHEYEVDADINATDSYDYGRLLLAQNNKTYKTVLVHTFNFSPLKKRIAMMTNTRKANKWKFLLALPLVGLCFTLMSAHPKSDDRIREGNITKYKGNTIEWTIDAPQEFEYTNILTGEKVKDIREGEEYIGKLNGSNVNIGLKRDWSNGKAIFFSPAIEKITESIRQAILNKKDQFPSNIALIEVHNLVIDDKLNVYYYDIGTSGEIGTDTTLSGFNRFPEINRKVDKILNDKKLINPNNIKIEKGYYSLHAHAGLKPASFSAKIDDPEMLKLIQKEIEAQRRAELENKIK